MRARNLKPGLFKNEILGSADPLLTILFEGLWCMADREGRLEDRPLRICAEVFPYRRALTERRVEKMLSWLAEQGLIVRYRPENGILKNPTSGDQKHNSASFIQVIEFKKHQNPHRDEAPSRIPALSALSHGAGTMEAPYENDASTVNAQKSPGLFSDSLIPESSLREREARAQASEPPREKPERGVTYFGTALTAGSAQMHAATAEEWQRSVPDCNVAAFVRWIEHWERIKGRAMGSEQRLGQARELAANGDHAAQLEVVDYCIHQDWKSLAPIADVRQRKRGMARGGPTRSGPTPTERDDARWPELKRRATASGFRAPYPVETADVFETALKIHERDNPARKASA